MKIKTSHKAQKRNPHFISFITLLILIQLSCGTSSNNSTTIAIVTSTTCPTNIPRTNYQSEYSPILIYTLVEGTENYREHIVYSFEILHEVLQNKIQPNDKVLVSFMEYADVELARIFNEEVANVEIPSYTYFPFVQPTIPIITPLPTTEGSFGQIVQTTEVFVTETAYSSLLTQAANDYNCSQIIEENQNRDLYKNWETNRQDAVNEFLNNYSSSIENIDLDNLSEITNPIRAMSQASEIFDLYRNPDTYKKDYLIIFSNLGAVISSPPSGDNINLEGVTVFVTLQECIFLSDCSGTVNRWDTYLKEAGATSVTFIHKGNELDTLLSGIER